MKTVAQQLEAQRVGGGSGAAAGPGCPPVAAAPFPLFPFRGGAPGFTGPEVAMATRPSTSPAPGDPPIPPGQPQCLGPESCDASSLRGRSACWGPRHQRPGREDPQPSSDSGAGGRGGRGRARAAGMGISLPQGCGRKEGCPTGPALRTSPLDPCQGAHRPSPRGSQGRRQVPPTPGHDLDSARGGDAGGQAGEGGGRQAAGAVGPLSGSRRAGGAVGGRPAPRALPTPGGGTGSAWAVGYMEPPGHAPRRLQRLGVPPKHPDSRSAAFLAPSWPRVSTGAGRGRGPPRPAPATWAADAPLGQHTRPQPPCVPSSWQKASSWGPGAATEQADRVTAGSRASPGEARPPASAGLDGLACPVLPWPRWGVLGDLGARGPITGCCSAPGALTPPRESRP